MDIRSIRDLFDHQLTDLYDAERRALDALPSLIEMVSDDPLRQALEEHNHRTRDHRLRLETVAHDLRIDLGEPVGTGLAEILEHSAKTARRAAQGPVRDAAIIASVQKVEHYEIAGYGAAASFARLLGEEDAADLLDRTLEEEKEADRKLSGIAENFVNEEAVKGA